MQGRVACAAATVWALLLVTGSDAALFVTDELRPTYPLLESRQCLPPPEQFDTSSTTEAARGCAAIARNTSFLPAACVGQQLLPLFYVCYADSQGLLLSSSAEDTRAAIQFLIDGMKRRTAALSTNQAWTAAALQLIDQCYACIDPSLELHQAAVYSFQCLKWSYFADCDRQQEERGVLDAEGTARRARFLSEGGCLHSPARLKRTLEEVTGRLWSDCSRGLDEDEGYTASIARILCLLQDWTDAAGRLHVAELRSAVLTYGTDPQHVARLLHIVDLCYTRAGAEEFVRCWAEKGVALCVYEQSNEVAEKFPESCQLSL